MRPLTVAALKQPRAERDFTVRERGKHHVLPCPHRENAVFLRCFHGEIAVAAR
jgi:hypothetical protein